jgi:hypothetical protein
MLLVGIGHRKCMSDTFLAVVESFTRAAADQPGKEMGDAARLAPDRNFGEFVQPAAAVDAEHGDAVGFGVDTAVCCCRLAILIRF